MIQGKRIVNTRAAHQAEVLNHLLQDRGAIPLSYPTIAIAAIDDTGALDAALQELASGAFAWLVLTSSNTVRVLSERCAALDLTLTQDTFRTAAIGQATADAAREQLGLREIFLPEVYVAESLAEALPLQVGMRIFLPESALARPVLADALDQRGAIVQVVPTYQTVCTKGGVDLAAMLEHGLIDAITFTSSSTVTCFVDRLRKEGGDLQKASLICAACIGSKTAATADEHGFVNVIAPTEFTLEGMLTALEAYFGAQITASQ